MYGGKWWMQYLKNISCHKHLALLIFHAIKSISPTLIITSNLSSFLVIKEMLFPSYNFFVIKQIYLLPIWSPDVIHFRCNKIYIEYIFLLQEKLRTLGACDSCVYMYIWISSWLLLRIPICHEIQQKLTILPFSGK